MTVRNRVNRVCTAVQARNKTIGSHAGQGSLYIYITATQERSERKGAVWGCLPLLFLEGGLCWLYVGVGGAYSCLLA